MNVIDLTAAPTTLLVAIDLTDDARDVEAVIASADARNQAVRRARDAAKHARDQAQGIMDLLDAMDMTVGLEQVAQEQTQAAEDDLQDEPRDLQWPENDPTDEPPAKRSRFSRRVHEVLDDLQARRHAGLQGARASRSLEAHFVPCAHARWCGAVAKVQ